MQIKIIQHMGLGVAILGATNKLGISSLYFHTFVQWHWIGGGSNRHLIHVGLLRRPNSLSLSLSLGISIEVII